MNNRCRANGSITKGGVEVLVVRCELDARHATRIPPGDFEEMIARARDGVSFDATPHRYAFTWRDADAIDLHDGMLDPDESFDVNVPTCGPLSASCIGSARGGPCSCGDDPWAA